MKNNFESLLVRSLRHYFDTSYIRAFVERRPQTRYKKQFVDVTVDSPHVGYLAIECKSTKGAYLNFLSNFHTVEDGLNHTHQIETISWYLHKTGRVGYLAVESRAPKGNQFSLIPWADVSTRFNSGFKGYKLDELRGYPRATKDKRTKLYEVSGLFPEFQADNS